MAAENMKFEPRSKPVRLAKAKIGCGKMAVSYTHLKYKREQR